MISLKKYIESNWEELLKSALHSYRSALEAMGNSGVQACPPVGATLRDSLLNLQQRLGEEVTASVVKETEEKVEAELDQWGQQASQYYKQRAGEFKEIMMILAQTAEIIGERDQRYAGQFHDFTSRLNAIADLHDLTEIRESLVRSACDLKACAEKMVEESKQSTAKLRQDVDKYQARLDDAERIAGLDSLTQLDSRRKAEASIEFRIAQQRRFTILILDLNGFKQINDTYGHVCGDEVLKQFSSELRSAFRATDVLGRWGGDEFIVVLDIDLEEAKSSIERVRKWVFGSYTVRVKGEPCKVYVDAAIGMAAWRSGDTMRDLLERADAAMYKDKRSNPRPAAAAGGKPVAPAR